MVTLERLTGPPSANPDKYTFCIAENSQNSPSGPLHYDMSLPADSSGVRVFALRITALYSYRLRLHPQRHRYSVGDC